MHRLAPLCSPFFAPTVHPFAPPGLSEPRCGHCTFGCRFKSGPIWVVVLKNSIYLLTCVRIPPAAHVVPLVLRGPESRFRSIHARCYRRYSCVCMQWDLSEGCYAICVLKEYRKSTRVLASCRYRTCYLLEECNCFRIWDFPNPCVRLRCARLLLVATCAYRHCIASHLRALRSLHPPATPLLLRD